MVSTSDPERWKDHIFSGKRGERLSAFLSRRFPEDHRIEAVAWGGESIVFLVTNVATGEKQMVKVGSDTDPRTRAAYKAEADLIALIHAQRPGQAENFTAIQRAELDGEFPLLFMKPKTGNLKEWAWLVQHSKTNEFDATLDLLEAITRPLGTLHGLGFSHGDFKTSNILIDTHNQELDGVQLADFGYTAPFGHMPAGMEEGTLYGTRDYSRPLDTWRLPPAGAHANPAADMYALHVTMLALVLGHRVDQTAADHAENTKTKLGDSSTLKASPLKVNPARHEVLSTLSWAEFNSTESALEAIHQARQYRQTPDNFYRNYFGPSYLSKQTPVYAANLIAGDQALLRRFDKGASTLGLTPLQYFQIAAEIGRLNLKARHRAG